MFKTAYCCPTAVYCLIVSPRAEPNSKQRDTGQMNYGGGKSASQIQQEIDQVQRSIDRQRQALFVAVAICFFFSALGHLLIVYIKPLKASANHLLQHFLPKIVHQEL